jgi:hypothetical protein
MNKSPIYHIASVSLSILAGIYSIISLWNNNIGEIQSDYVVTLIFITIGINIVIYCLWLIISRSPAKSALLSIATYIFLYSFGHIYNIIGNQVILGIEIGFIKLFVLWTGFFIIACFLIFRMKQVDFSMIVGMNITVLALLLFNIVPVISFELQVGLKGSKTQTTSEPIPTANSEQPDIYYIVLDSYTRSDVLKSLMGYDNSDFINELKKRGFYVPDCAYSNYNGTAKTIASVLNFEYLQQGWRNENDDDVKKPSPANVNLIKNNKVLSYFSRLGYKFVTGRAFSPFMYIDKSDIYLNYSMDNTGKDDLDRKQFLNLYLNTTVFRVLAESYKNNPLLFLHLPYWLIDNDVKDAYYNNASLWYNQNLYMFDSIAKFPQKPGNYLVYAHIIAPHGPYVFRADGSFRYPLDTNDEKVLYVDAVKYLNKRVLELVDTLLSESKVPPVIIIQGDHGVHKLTHDIPKHKILSAYYLPGKLITPPYATITPVNNFRMIIRDYFDPSMELLPDTLYLTGSDNRVVESSCDLK